jgi:large subunit ribosomal protein L9
MEKVRIMQIILKEDVKDLGRSGEMVTVAEGYARNYLLPRKLAVSATPGNQKDLQKRIVAAKEREARERQDAESVGTRIRETRLTLTGRAAEGSTRLHGSITAENIAAALSQALSMPFDKRNVELKNPIRTLGVHQVSIKLLKGLTAPVTVEVVDAAAQAEAAAQAAAQAQAAREAKPAPEAKPASQPEPAPAPEPEPVTA